MTHIGYNAIIDDNAVRYNLHFDKNTDYNFSKKDFNFICFGLCDWSYRVIFKGQGA